MKSMYRIRLVAIAAGLACGLAVTVALAAARYDHSTPVPGEVFAAAPGRIDVFTRRTTSAVPGDSQIAVIDVNQRRVDQDDAAVDPADHHHLSAHLPSSLPAGRYVVTFKTLGERDLDHDGGQFAFYVGAPPTPAERAADATLVLTTVTNDESLTGYRRGLVEGGLTFLIGGPAALYYIHKRQARKADGECTGSPCDDLTLT